MKAKNDLWSPSAQEIKQALARHHSKDVFVDECKNGPSWVSNGLLRMDAWVLPRKWNPANTIGYEIKVSRSDFTQDQKWVSYLPLCHYFFFVCPAGLIRAPDLPKGVGLKWYSRAGNIHTKLWAERREPDTEKFLQLLTYIIMCRSLIVKEPTREQPPEEPEDRIQRLKRMVLLDDEKKELSHLVAANIRSRFDEMKLRCVAAENALHEAHKFAEQLAQLGITWNPDSKEWHHRWDVEREIEALATTALSDQELRHIEAFGERIAEFVGNTRQVMKRLKGGQ